MKRGVNILYTGKELKIKRIIKDIKAVDVAKHLCLHKSYISKMEREVQTIPKHIYNKWITYLEKTN